ncbi:MAG: hypothetical protein CM15mP103_02760 [Gammaproteobacteria bacterium]|nr:MAG: hypothetical protein CM15mP103_02760 [Gammaproteobacteria bacterium]
MAVDIFEDFNLFERSAVQVDVLRLIFKPAWSIFRSRRKYWRPASASADILAPGGPRILSPRESFDDIATSVITATDQQTGERFTRKS